MSSPEAGEATEKILETTQETVQAQPTESENFSSQEVDDASQAIQDSSPKSQQSSQEAHDASAAIQDLSSEQTQIHSPEEHETAESAHEEDEEGDMSHDNVETKQAHVDLDDDHNVAEADELENRDFPSEPVERTDVSTEAIQALSIPKEQVDDITVTTSTQAEQETTIRPGSDNLRPHEEEEPANEDSKFGTTFSRGNDATHQKQVASMDESIGAGEQERELRPMEARLSFVIMPEGYSHTADFNINETVASVKMTLEKQLKISFNNIKLLINGATMSNPQRLSSYGVRPGDTPSVELQIEYLERPPPRQLPENIVVTVDFGPGMPMKNVYVKVVNAQRRKKFIGGFRDRRTGLEYHHAIIQTDPPPLTPEQRRRLAIVRFHRETQTVHSRTRSTTSIRECGTQMPKVGVVVEDSTDVTLFPRPYFDSSQLDQLRLEKAIKIQCHVRGWFARILSSKMRKQRNERLAEIALQEAERQRDAELKRRREMERRMHPRSKTDFDVLYHELDGWRQQETYKINESGLPETERLAALAQLLHKETKLLQTIDRLKISAASENNDVNVKSMLSNMSSAKKWMMSDGKMTEVHTPFTTRARELQELYNGLRLPLLTVDERLDVLLHVKWTVKEFDCNLTRDLVELIDREADMLNRGRSESSLQGLRKRIANLFLQFVQTPEFNPEAIRFQKVPRELLVPPNVRPIH